jgi:hypothetical protein
MMMIRGIVHEVHTFIYPCNTGLVENGTALTPQGDGGAELQAIVARVRSACPYMQASWVLQAAPQGKQ